VTPRELPWTCHPILEWLARLDLERFGRSHETNKKLFFKEMDESRLARVEKLKRKRREMLGLQRELLQRAWGQKQTFGPGHIRSRNHFAGGSEEYAEAIQEYQVLSKE
jgi:hypothetical protein